MTLFAHAGRIGLGSCWCVLLITGACLSDGWAEDQERPRRHSLISRPWMGLALADVTPPSATLPPTDPKPSHSLLPPAHRRASVPESSFNELDQAPHGLAESRSVEDRPRTVTAAVERRSTQPFPRSARRMGFSPHPRSPFPSSVVAGLSPRNSPMPASHEPSIPRLARRNGSLSDRAVTLEATVTPAMSGIKGEGPIRPGS